MGSALDKYIESRSAILSPATVREYKRSRRCDLQSLMDKNIHDITQDMIQALINEEAKSHSPKTVGNMHGLLSAVMKEHRPDFALNTTLPKKVRPKIYVPKDYEVKKIIQAVADTELEIPVLLTAFGPMRRSEICALDSDHVKGNTVHVEFAIVLNDNNEWVKKDTKSYAGNRYIEFPNFVADKLQGITERIVSLNPAMITNRFFDMLEKEEINHFRFHDLRHYCASIQHAFGLSVMRYAIIYIQRGKPKAVHPTKVKL